MVGFIGDLYTMEMNPLKNHLKKQIQVGLICWVRKLPLWKTCWEHQMLSNVFTEKTFGVLNSAVVAVI